VSSPLTRPGAIKMTINANPTDTTARSFDRIDVLSKWL